MKREWLILVLWIAIFILIRSVYFKEGLNFSQDQASDSLRGLELLRQNKITLIGTETGYNYHGRLLFMGPLFIYTYLAYNLLGQFNPITSSYIFMFTGSLSIIPLYFGMKRLTNNYTAILSVALYTLFPYFINYTKFMWNPNFQFILTPYLIYCFSLFNTNKSTKWLLATSVVMGALLQYHYQFAVVVCAMGAYLISQTSKLRNSVLYLSGLALGFLPVILFEMRHNFYNLRTVVLYMKHFDEVFLTNSTTTIQPHFFLSLSFIAVCILLTIFKRRIKPHHVAISILILIPFTTQTFVKPDRMYNSHIQWRIEDELKTYEIVKKLDLNNTNISHLDYDNTAIVQKYFLKRDRISISHSYYTNRYLLAISKTDDFDTYKAYEISQFVPRNILKTWQINDTFKLYLLQRAKNNYE